MKIKSSLFGYNKKEVEEKLDEVDRLLTIQKKDIEFLKNDNARLRALLDKNSDNEEIK